MAQSSRFRFFPVTHIAGVALTLVVITLVLFWPGAKTPHKIQKILPLPAPVVPDAAPPAPPARKWEEDDIRSGGSLSALFSRNQLSAADVIEIAAIAPKDAIRLRPGQKVRWIRSGGNHVQEMEFELSPLAKHRISRNAEGKLVYQMIERDAEYLPRFAETRIDNSMFLDGERAGIPESTLIEIANIFGWDIDFAQDIRKGDEMSVIYQEIYLDGEKIGNGNILSVRFRNQGTLYTAIRYEDKSGNASYYTPEGMSMRKAFLRNPIDFFRISSRFSLGRKHPILNTIRAHKGTDYAAPIGTPVKAAGNGKVTFAGRQNGYGNVVIIQHGSRYETRYAHLNGFARDVRAGRSVKQGQVIGYVGMTGLATGPHLHYEFRVDGVHRDSLTIKLPTAEPIAASERATFLVKAKEMTDWMDRLSVKPAG
jgi:murein DD-endopeptidase MepM/ murein hydrolase activator NlpD